MGIWYLNYFSLSFKFIYFERDRDCMSEGGAERGRERENPKQALHCQHRARCRVQTHKLRDGDLSQNQESDA